MPDSTEYIKLKPRKMSLKSCALEMIHSPLLNMILTLRIYLQHAGLPLCLWFSWARWAEMIHWELELECSERNLPEKSFSIDQVRLQHSCFHKNKGSQTGGVLLVLWNRGFPWSSETLPSFSWPSNSLVDFCPDLDIPG